MNNLINKWIIELASQEKISIVKLLREYDIEVLGC